MESSTYAAEANVEATHWWFVGRRRLFSNLLSKLDISPDATVLDVGSSTGTNLRLLKGLGYRQVTGLDMSPEAIEYCREKGLGVVLPGDVCRLQFEDEAFSFVFATDIIEHVDDDLLALREIARVLKDGGQVIFTVPAFRSLWGLQDEVSHHKRRYRKQELIEKLEAAGFVVDSSFYFNYVLFVPIWLARQLIRVFRVQLTSENVVNTGVINRLLTCIFLFDITTAPWLRPPFGVSVLAVARKATPGGV